MAMPSMDARTRSSLVVLRDNPMNPPFRSGDGSWALPPARVGLNMTPLLPGGTLSAMRFMAS